MSNWSHSIKVSIAERFYPLRIDKEDDEERIRKAAKLINDKLFHYKKQFNDKDVQDFLAMAALQYVIKLTEEEERLEKDYLPGVLKELIQKIDLVLDSRE